MIETYPPLKISAGTDLSPIRCWYPSRYTTWMRTVLIMLIAAASNTELSAQEGNAPQASAINDEVAPSEPASNSTLGALDITGPPTERPSSVDGVVAASRLELAEQQAFQQAVDVVSPAVVQIETFGGLERVEDKTIAAGPMTGTIIDADGWIVTSLYGLSQQPASILVNLQDGTRVPARIVARDYSREIVLLKIQTLTGLPTAIPSEPTSWQVGQWSVAVGKTYDTKSVTQSHGIVSALGRAYGRAIQTDCKVSPINYGGPLIDIYGRVIGILTPIAAAEMLGEDGTVLYDSGIGFAVPLTEIAQRLPVMKNGIDIRAGKLGVVTADANEMAGPVKLTGAAPGSPAAKAGVKSGDVIVQAQGKKVELLADLRHLLASTDAGQRFEFVVERGQEMVTLQCELVDEIPVYRRRFFGMQVESIDAGLRIRALIQPSPAASAGLEIGQVVTHCDGKKVAKREDLASLLAVSDLEIPLQLSVQSGDGQSIREVPVLPLKWPEKLPEHVPLAIPPGPDAAANVSHDSEITELKFADIPNKIHAIIPPNARSRQLGCLVVYGQPGELAKDKLKSTWERLAIDFGWLVVFPESADSQAWSRDEVELASRLLKRLDQEYSFDRSRTAVGGLGVGGQLALVAAFVEKERISGVFTLGTQLRRLPLRGTSAPMQTLDFLLVGDQQLEAIAEQLASAGYVANSVVADIDIERWETVPMDVLTRWLEILAYL